MHGQLQLVELVELARLEALGLEAVLARGLEDVARLAAVARHAALDAQLLERRPQPVVRETMPSAAAPHSTASICRMVGVTTFLFGGRGMPLGLAGASGGGSGAGMSATGLASSEDGQHVADRRLPCDDDRHRDARAAVDLERRSGRRGPRIAARHFRIRLEHRVDLDLRSGCEQLLAPSDRCR